jgi:hypothetical protein
LLEYRHLLLLNGMNDVDKVTVSIIQNDTSVYLIGDI